MPESDNETSFDGLPRVDWRALSRYSEGVKRQIEKRESSERGSASRTDSGSMAYSVRPLQYIDLGGQAGVMLCVELPDGRRVLQAGGVDVIDAEQAQALVSELQRVIPWLDRTNVSRATEDCWEQQRGGA